MFCIINYRTGVLSTLHYVLDLKTFQGHSVSVTDVIMHFMFNFSVFLYRSCRLLLTLTFVGDLPGHLEEQQFFNRQLILLPGWQHPAQRRHGQGTRQWHLEASRGAPTDRSWNVKQSCCGGQRQRDSLNRPRGEGSWAEQGQSPRTQQDKITGNHESKVFAPRLLGLTLYSHTHKHTNSHKIRHGTHSLISTCQGLLTI